MAGIQERGGSHAKLFRYRGKQRTRTLAKSPRTKPGSSPLRSEVPDVDLHGGMVTVGERERVRGSD
jgi:hypothetical protein